MPILAGNRSCAIATKPAPAAATDAKAPAGAKPTTDAKPVTEAKPGTDVKKPAGTIAAAPEQWYSFKPIWPSDPVEAAELEARAATMLASGVAMKTETAGQP